VRVGGREVGHGCFCDHDVVEVVLHFTVDLHALEVGVLDNGDEAVELEELRLEVRNLVAHFIKIKYLNQ
jgi:hypothetical protein